MSAWGCAAYMLRDEDLEDEYLAIAVVCSCTSNLHRCCDSDANRRVNHAKFMYEDRCNIIPMTTRIYILGVLMNWWSWMRIPTHMYSKPPLMLWQLLNVLVLKNVYLIRNHKHMNIGIPLNLARGENQGHFDKYDLNVMNFAHSWHQTSIHATCA